MKCPLCEQERGYLGEDEICVDCLLEFPQEQEDIICSDPYAEYPESPDTSLEADAEP